MLVHINPISSEQQMFGGLRWEYWFYDITNRYIASKNWEKGRSLNTISVCEAIGHLINKDSPYEVLDMSKPPYTRSTVLTEGAFSNQDLRVTIYDGQRNIIKGFCL